MKTSKTILNKGNRCEQNISIYVHIPFCEQKCNYCAFNSFCASEKVKDEYLDLLCKEIQVRKIDRKVQTIYIGGGTPSTLSCAQIEKVGKCIFENFEVMENAEFTIEANPNSITEELLKTWQGLGVNRLSVGVQSLDDESLKKIGRLHTKMQAVEKLELASKFFDNISADLIVGLEGETSEKLCNFANQLLSCGVKHISCYLLEIYQNTKLFELIKKGKYHPLDDDKTIDNFNALADFLQEKGMWRYEISNFAFPDFESQHNLNYWKRGEYLGFGLSAHSFLDGIRSKNAETLAEYKKGKRKYEKLTKKEILEEIIMLGLRCYAGVELDKVKRLGYDITKNPFFEEYKKDGILIQKDDKIFLNPKFYHLSNTIISNLFA